MPTAYVLLSVIASSSILFSTNASASDIANGKKLYEKNCNGCHDTRVHTRPNRIIHTYEDLVNRVKFCDGAANTKFNDAQITDVVDHLNAAYYKFVK